MGIRHFQSPSSVGKISEFHSEIEVRTSCPLAPDDHFRHVKSIFNRDISSDQSSVVRHKRAKLT